MAAAFAHSAFVLGLVAVLTAALPAAFGQVSSGIPATSEFATPVTYLDCHIAPYNENVRGLGCYRWVEGFDITGVTNDVQLTTADSIFNQCDCMKACKDRATTCDSYVWKFTDTSGKRTCTLYSNFNLPPNVNLLYNSTDPAALPLPGNNPQAGGNVPHCTVDGTSTGASDPHCRSGPIWALDDGSILC